MFKVGDRVICVNNNDFDDYLTINKIYNVLSIIDNMIYILDDKDNMFAYYFERFKKVKDKLTIEEAKEKIKELQEYIDKEKNKLCITNISEIGSNEKRVAINGKWAYSLFNKNENNNPMIVLQTHYGDWVDNKGFQVPNSLYFKPNK